MTPNQNDYDLVDVRLLSTIADPSNFAIWYIDPPIQRLEIKYALDMNFLDPTPHKKITSRITTINIRRMYHIARIAYLIKNGWQDPIMCDFGADAISSSTWPIVDGNHRYLAALYTNQVAIRASISGELSRFEHLLI